MSCCCCKSGAIRLWAIAICAVTALSIIVATNGCGADEEGTDDSTQVANDDSSNGDETNQDSATGDTETDDSANTETSQGQDDSSDESTSQDEPNDNADASANSEQVDNGDDSDTDATDSADQNDAEVNGEQAVNSLPEAVVRGPVIAQIAAAESEGEASAVDVKVSLDIEGGWHTYASLPVGSTYVLTEISLKLPEGVETLAELSRPTGVPYLAEPGCTVFEGQVEFAAKIAKPAEPTQVIAEIKFQACDADKCNLPQSFQIGVMVE